MTMALPGGRTYRPGTYLRACLAQAVRLSLADDWSLAGSARRMRELVDSDAILQRMRAIAREALDDRWTPTAERVLATLDAALAAPPQTSPRAPSTGGRGDASYRSRRALIAQPADRGDLDECLRLLPAIALTLHACLATSAPPDRTALQAAIDTLDGIVRECQRARFLELAPTYRAALDAGLASAELGHPGLEIRAAPTGRTS